MFAQQATGTCILCVGYSFTLQTESLKKMLHGTWDHRLRQSVLSGVSIVMKWGEGRIHGGLFGELYQNMSSFFPLFFQFAFVLCHLCHTLPTPM